MAILDESKVSKKRNGVGSSVLDEKNLINEKRERKTKTKIKSSFTDIAPVIDVTPYEFFEMSNGEYMEILQITSKDIYSLNEEDKNNDIDVLANFFQAYLGSCKFVPLNTPVNLEIPKKHVLKDIRENKNPLFLADLEKKYNDMLFIEQNRTDKEFFLFIYAKDEKTLLENRRHAKKLMGRSNPLIELSLDKKNSILFQLANLNTKSTIEF